jgi:hypothetical protein
MPDDAKNPLEMSDEDIMKMNPPEVETQEDEPKEEPKEEEKSTEEGNSSDLDESSSNEEENNNSSEESSNNEDDDNEKKNDDVKEPEDKEDISPSGSEEKKTEESKEEKSKQSSEKEVTIDYKKFYEKIMTPFKANGKLITLKTPEEAIQLMQMGANYTRKMQAIAPYKKTLMMLENNNLLDEDKLSFLIDLDKKNPEAIKKLIKDAGIDPLEIDTSTEPQYKEGSHKVSNEEAAFMSVLDDLKQSQEGMQTIQEINSNWDDASKKILWNSPEIMRTIHQQRANGVYKIITEEMERQRVLGNIPVETPFLMAYKQIGDALAAKQKPAPMQPVAVKAKAVKTSSLKNNEKAKAAAPNRTTASAPKKFINPLAMSDEEFLKQMENRL